MNIGRSIGWSLCLVLVLIGQNSYSQNPDLVIERVHMEHVYNVIFSPNGNLIASTSFDNNLKLWDAHSFREIRPIAKYCHSIAFTNDGKFILCANRTIQVIDPATGTQTSEIKPAVQVAGEIQVLPGSNSLIAAGKDGIVRRLDLATGSEIARFESSEQGERTAFVVSPDGRLLAVGRGTFTSTIWDITNRTPIKVIPIGVEHGSFSRNNKYLAAPGSWSGSPVGSWHRQYLLSAEIQQLSRRTRYV
jgi:WD40 repeat protein